ncbi:MULTISPECIES: aromatic ring-hydroxylating oxygenase subunit alpha [unclassified Sphingomonas]|uniref:aromatic ring-hydroxylating oxygenase subunit alpha n=1 Tax=unclassified Sphingomonas TaxID=196159 RepID=UPI0006F8B23D|nr:MULTISPECIES: aromatic ring-hydroxylating dioxygenase subunit alpha [unclassified Sphingomonas]KQX17883.1 (2Fe-2S)-binding protein [Sphingomonas sp. Root1294]KQY70809.1 (2Fe-2S)-binding protein [Sphingomonas sp. Root50]KRB91696.1 (2Fe-2S)-binding protein [Sphingomonas sp. Root720]
MADRDPKLPGRSPGISWTELMGVDSRPAPACLTQEHYEYLGSDPLQAERYTSEDFARAERERMWPHVWQFVAREEDLPEPGDYVVYENAGRSFLISRQEDGSVRAMHNVCLHRGRKLRTEDGTTDRFVCPFHGFAWHKDGSFDSMPCQWDFTHLKPDAMTLPLAEVGRWQGYIFLREEAGGPTLEEYLAPLPEHFTRWRHDECTTVIWVAKQVPANWKATAEAFMEAWHTVVTHPQLLPFTGDCNSAYWNWGDNVNVNLVPFGIMSPHVDADGKTQQWIVDEFVKYNGRSADNYETANDPFAVVVPDGMTAREALGAAMRAGYTAQTGYDHEDATDSELLDALVYNVFPNFAPWGGYMPNIVYRWRPGATPDTCLMEVRVLSRVKKGEPIPRGVPMNLLGIDQPWTDAPELGILGDVLDQDMANLRFVQEGLHCSKTGKVQLADYQEIRIRQFHRTLEKYLGGEAGATA